MNKTKETRVTAFVALSFVLIATVVFHRRVGLADALSQPIFAQETEEEVLLQARLEAVVEPEAPTPPAPKVEEEEDPVAVDATVAQMLFTADSAEVADELEEPAPSEGELEEPSAPEQPEVHAPEPVEPEPTELVRERHSMPSTVHAPEEGGETEQQKEPAQLAKNTPERERESARTGDLSTSENKNPVIVLTPGAKVPEGIKTGRVDIKLKGIEGLLNHGHVKLVLKNRLNNKNYIPFTWSHGVNATRFKELREPLTALITNLSTRQFSSGNPEFRTKINELKERLLDQYNEEASKRSQVEIHYYVTPKISRLLRLAHVEACKKHGVIPEDSAARRVSIDVTLFVGPGGEPRGELTDTRYF